MDGVIFNVVVEIVIRVVVDLFLLGVGFFILFKIENVWLVGVVSFGVLLLGVFYFICKGFMEGVIKRVLERILFGDVDFEVINIIDGYFILVEL